MPAAATPATSRSPPRTCATTPTTVPTLANGGGEETCGDADGSGEVTVTDGVQTLRAAADLSSTCTLPRCDVNGSGSITVSDGVQVLRAAAGLSVNGTCTPAN